MSNHSAIDSPGWKYKMWCKNPSDNPRKKGEAWRRKENLNEEQQQNEEHRQMKIKNEMKIQEQNEDQKWQQHHKKPHW